VKKLISNGKRNPSFPFLKPVNLKIREKQESHKITGFREENSDTVGEKLRKLDHKETSSSRTTRLKLSKRGLRPSLSKKHLKERSQEVQEDQEVLADQEDQEDSTRVKVVKELKVVKAVKVVEDDIF
jgi:hypothetical protein